MNGRAGLDGWEETTFTYSATTRRVFVTLALDRTSPIVGWLRALAADAHAECGGVRVGAIAHSVLSEHFVDEPGHLTREAFDRVLAFLTERLHSVYRMTRRGRTPRATSRATPPNSAPVPWDRRARASRPSSRDVQNPTTSPDR